MKTITLTGKEVDLLGELLEQDRDVLKMCISDVENGCSDEDDDVESMQEEVSTCSDILNKLHKRGELT